MASDNGGHRRPTAVERQVQEVETERNAELFAQEMRRRPKPRRSEVVFARVGANERDEFFDGCGRHRQKLWEELRLDRFWAERLAAQPQGHALGSGAVRAGGLPAAGAGQRVAAASATGSSAARWRICWARTAALAEIHKLYRCHDRLLAHKQALFDHLVGRWRDLFNASFDVLLYDLTSTYFEADPPFPEGDKRRFGYSRDHRPDCVQVVIALVVTPEGLPLAYEVLPGNTADKTTLRGFLDRIERQYGKARRIWLMDRGIPTEEVLAEMRAGRSAGALSGRHAQGAPEPPGAGAAREALARRPGPACRSSCCRRTASSTCSPRAATASPRSARCAGGS